MLSSEAAWNASGSYVTEVLIALHYIERKSVKDVDDILGARKMQ